MTYIEKIINVTTGEETLRPFTVDEIAAIEAEQAQIAAAKAEHDAQEATKAAARQAVLDKLGLTADEMAALFS